MRNRGLPVALATALMLVTALPSSAANGYDGGLVKTVDRTSAAEQSEGRSEGFYGVRDRGEGGHRGGGNGGYRGGGHHRGGKYRGHHRHNGRHDYYPRRNRYYGHSYGYDRDYYYDDYLGAFVLGGALGYILSY